MAQAQYGGRGQGAVVCNACNVVYDFLERAPKLLNCGHWFCVQCLRTMRKDEFIVCHSCGHCTPAPKSLAWLPTHADALPKWRDSDVKPRLSSGTSNIQRPSSLLWPYTPQTALDERPLAGTSDAAARGNPLRVVTGLSWASPGPRRANAKNDVGSTSAATKGFPSAAEDQVCQEFEMSLYHPNASMPNSIKLLWSDFSTNPNDTNEVPNVRTNNECSSQPRFYSNPNENVRFGPLNDLQPASMFEAWCPSPPYGSDLPDSLKVNQMTQELNDLVEKLAIATSSVYDKDRWIFSFYFEEERRNILRNLLDLQKEETLIRPLRLVRNSCQPCKSQMFDGEVPRFGTDTIAEIKTFLTKMQSLEGEVARDNAIFRLCVILMYQRYKTFLQHIENATAHQENGPNLAVTSDYNSYFSHPNQYANSASEHIPTRDSKLQSALERSESAQTRSIIDAIVARAKKSSLLFDQNLLKNKQISDEDNIVDINRPEADVPFDILPFKIPWKDLANLYYLDFEINGVPAGRVIVEIFPSMTPLMSANFAVLCSGSSETSYKGCRVFQCWNGQSIITGDTENNTGNGGKSILNDEFFVPDQKSLPAERGTIGMRRLARNPKTQKGKVSSQFRILLNKQPKITGLFGYVVSGIEVVDKISQLDDGKGNPRKRAIISKCGKLDI